MSIKQAIYAGSFDPWTFGHQFVLDSALQVFDKIHIVSAINPSKSSAFTPQVRARIIAHSIDPFQDWWFREPPFEIGAKVVVTSQMGLIADYSEKHQVKHLIRGLRSTTDFEAEFNLYFSNQAIKPELQTWAIMCPPRLLHCSSTFVKTVVGQPGVRFVGTNFISQALMLSWHRVVGQIFDLIEVCSLHRFGVDGLNLNRQDLSESLQCLFASLFEHHLHIPRGCLIKASKFLDVFLKREGNNIKERVYDKQEFPEEDVNFLWALLLLCIERDRIFTKQGQNTAAYVLGLSRNLGRTMVKIYDEKPVWDTYLALKHEHSI